MCEKNPDTGASLCSVRLRSHPFVLLPLFLFKQTKAKNAKPELVQSVCKFFFFSLDQENTIFKLNQLPATLRNIPNAVLFFSFLYN